MGEMGSYPSSLTCHFLRFILKAFLDAFLECGAFPPLWFFSPRHIKKPKKPKRRKSAALQKGPLVNTSFSFSCFAPPLPDAKTNLTKFANLSPRAPVRGRYLGA